jgi:2,3-bisphosphoglycerate-independent phosphoglycerate mutase
VDRCVGEVVDAGLGAGYVVMITGDHGNIETMFYPDGEPNPSHGLNPVPFILVSDDPELKKAGLRSGLGLSSIAPTILHLMGVERPQEMNGEVILAL